MKRNNIFMWAYITSIGISVVLRIFTDYSLWSSVVSAVTVSCAFFAIEDLLYLLCCAINDSCEIMEYYILKLSNVILNNIDFGFNVSGEDVDEVLEAVKKYTTEGDFVDKWIQDRDSTKKRLLDYRKQVKKYKMFANAVAYIGFLSLFCFVFFSQYISISDLTQDIFTVISFMVILITQQLKEKASKYARREMTDVKNILRYGESISKELEKVQLWKKSISNTVEAKSQFDKKTSELEDANNAN